MTEYTDEQRQADQAMVLLDTWGSTTTPPEPIDGYAFAESGYAPEWLSESELDCDRDWCLTVLHNTYGDPVVPWGHEECYQYACGERSCTACDGSGHEYNHETGDHDETLGPCLLCEGDGVVYWGDEWSVVVFRPKHRPRYTAPPTGREHDLGPVPARTASRLEAWTAIRDELESVGDYHQGLSRRLLARICRDLRATGRHDFDRRLARVLGMYAVMI